MSELTQELDKLIQKAALDGALTKDAVEMFHSIVTENGELRALRSSNAEQITKLKKELDEKNSRLNVLKNECETWAGKEQDLLDRESQAEVLEMTVKYEQKRVDDHKSMVGLIFRNAVIKKGVMTPLAPSEPNQYNSCPSGGYAQKDDVEEEQI